MKKSTDQKLAEFMADLTKMVEQKLNEFSVGLEKKPEPIPMPSFPQLDSQPVLAINPVELFRKEINLDITASGGNPQTNAEFNKRLALLMAEFKINALNAIIK